MAKIKKALITGITGQDGSYLAELLLYLGYEVHGIVRPASTFNRSRIDHLLQNESLVGRLFLYYGDLSDSSSISNLLISIRPDELYNLAAQSHVGISFQIPEYSAMVNGVAFNSILETIRIQKLDTRVYQACTSEMFGSTLPPQSLISEFKPQSPYAASKVFAYHVSQNYRHAYNMHITCGIFFNHESHRRGLNFVTKKIVDSLVKIKKKEIKIVKLGNLESSRDWGWAPEYVVAMWQMLQKDCPIDLVVGTGVSAKVIDFFRHSSFILGLDPNRLIEIDPSYVRPLEVESLCADTAEMSRVLGWTPKVKWQELAKIMIEDQLINKEREIEWEKLIHQDLQF